MSEAAAMALGVARPVLAQLRMWLEMTRPRVLGLVLFTGLPMLGMAEGGWPSLSLSLWVLFGTALAGAASSTFNAWYERDSDAQMARTKNRPLPATAVAPGQALALSWVLTVTSTVVLWAVGGPLAAGVGLATIAFYVLVYTIWLKPRTPQNIVIGGAAGATAPLIVEAAVDGRLGWGSLILFLIVFLWTPPHFWAIAIFRKKEYEAAGFPMMPSVIGDRATRRQSLWYTLALVAVSLLPVPLGLLSTAYGVVALALGAWFTLWVVRSMLADQLPVDWRVFKVSISYLTLLFGVMLVDCVVRSILRVEPAWLYPVAFAGGAFPWPVVIAFLLACSAAPVDAPALAGPTPEGGYQIALVLTPDPPALSQLFSVDVAVTDAAGAPVEDARVVLDARMPAHAHGMATVPIAAPGDCDAAGRCVFAGGRYRTDGMKFHMPGDWVFEIEVHRGGETERVHFPYRFGP